MKLKAKINPEGKSPLGLLYSWIAGLTFAWLEISGMYAEWKEAATLGEFLTGQFWEYIFSMESIMNAWYAAIWPYYWYVQLT